jgi:hypothetical protein
MNELISKGRRFPAKSLADIALDEEVYAADFALGERYQAFSSEIVRLALLGIAGYGFLLAEVAPSDSIASSEFFARLRQLAPLLIAGLLALGLAVGCALAHRFFSTDCLAHQITIVRLLRRREGAEWKEDERLENEQRLASERKDQLADLRRCTLLLQGSALLLFVGAAITVLSFVLALGMR